MTVIPEAVRESEASQYLLDKGFKLYHRGKVRDTFEVPGHPDRLLQVATDRLSIFGFVLPVLLPRQGEVLTALTRFWMMRVSDRMGNYLVPSERQRPEYNAAVDLKLGGLDKLPLERCLVVRRVKIWPYKMVFRHHLGGSVYEEYRRTGKVAGIQVLSGLQEWAYLGRPSLFTPAIKTQSGHDANITVKEFGKEMGRRGAWVVTKLREIYHWAYGFARQCRICILDTKFEVGVPEGETKRGRRALKPILANELFTPDSSRFAYEGDWNYAMKQNRDPAFFDKQVVRDWGMTVETPWGKGLHQLDSRNPDHLQFVSQLEVPQGRIELTEERYLKVFEFLTGMTLDAYQHSYLLFAK